MNKYDTSDFRQIHKHRHVKSSKKQQVINVGPLAMTSALPPHIAAINTQTDTDAEIDNEQEMFTI